MVDIHYEPRVFTAEESERLDIFLTRMLPDYSRSFIQKLCREGSVEIDYASRMKPGTLLQGGETVIIMMPVVSADHRTGTMEIIFEDNDVCVLNKPAGMLTHAKGAQNDEFTVGDFMRIRTTDGADTNRPGIVHRLDRDTSGVMIAAKNPAAKQWLQKQFSNRKVKKTYSALVVGHPAQAAAVIQLPIERNPQQPHTFRVGGNGKPAETLYETITSFEHVTLLKLQPHTGRTHQLRVHMKYMGCPVVGDRFYGKPEPRLGRLFLHASELELTLPSKERTVFHAPLPPELQTYIDWL